MPLLQWWISEFWILYMGESTGCCEVTAQAPLPDLQKNSIRVSAQLCSFQTLCPYLSSHHAEHASEGIKLREWISYELVHIDSFQSLSMSFCWTVWLHSGEGRGLWQREACEVCSRETAVGRGYRKHDDDVLLNRETGLWNDRCRGRG